MTAPRAMSSFPGRPSFPEDMVAVGLQSRFPQGRLYDLVHCFWSLDKQLSARNNPTPIQLTPKKLYPDGGVSLMIRLHQDNPVATLLFNRQTQLHSFDLGEPLLSVRFHPGVLHGLFGISPAECLSGEEIGLSDVLQGDDRFQFSSMLIQLLEMNGRERMARLEQWLTTYLEQKSLYRRRLAYLPRMLSSHGPLTEVAGDLGMSTRTLERHCVREIGMAPSVLLECLRMRKARQLLGATELPLAELALICGYYDQAHFNRAFSNFVGETPGAYRRRKLSHFYKA